MPCACALGDHLAQAKQILENLQRQDHRNAAAVLKERIAACEACSLLVCKPIRAMKESDLKVVLTTCQDAWKLFDSRIKTKLAEHAVVHQALPAVAAALRSKNSAKQSEAMQAVAKAVCLGDCFADDDEPFNVGKPCFRKAFLDLLDEVRQRMDSSAFADDAQCLIGIDAVQEHVQKARRPADPEGARLQEIAEDRAAYNAGQRAFGCRSVNLNRQTNKQTDKQTNKQTKTQTNKLSVNTLVPGQVVDLLWTWLRLSCKLLLNS